MMNPNDSNNKSYNEDELNLLPVFVFLKKIMKVILNEIKFYTDVFEKRIKSIVAFTLIGITIALGNFYLAKPVYTTHMVVTSNLLSNEYCASMIEDLYFLSKERNYSVLSEKL